MDFIELNNSRAWPGLNLQVWHSFYNNFEKSNIAPSWLNTSSICVSISPKSNSKKFSININLAQYVFFLHCYWVWQAGLGRKTCAESCLAASAGEAKFGIQKRQYPARIFKDYWIINLLWKSRCMDAFILLFHVRWNGRRSKSIFVHKFMRVGQSVM